MQQGPAAWLATAREKWSTITRSQRIALIAGVVISIALLVGFIIWSQQTPYSVLFSNLQSNDASSIVDKLKTQKIPYQVTDGGKAILVPTSVVNETRLMLAGAGLPAQGVVGFEIFDKTNPLGMTDFLQQVDYQRALEGELTRTIEQINGVSQASVSIVLPQSSLYTSTQASATAAVTLALTPGTTLDPGQVKAVMHLVASSVQGLKPNDVTIVDTNGNNLSDMVNSASLANGVTPSSLGTALDVQHQYEANLDAQVQTMLSTVLGPGKSVVRVNATLNWDQIQQDSTTYGPQPGVIGSQNINNISSNGNSGNPPSGVPGTTSNLVPTPTSTPGTGTGNTYTQSQSNTVYNVSQVVQHLQKAPGGITRLTVAVFLDGTYPAATITSIQQAVANAIGLDAVRGDQITVSAIPFNRSVDIAAQNALQAQQKQAQTDLIIRGIVLALVALSLIIFAFRSTRRPKPKLATSITLIDDQRMVVSPDGSVRPLSEIVGPDGQPAIGSGEGNFMLGTGPENILLNQRRTLTEEEQEYHRKIKEELVEIAKQHPEVLANVVMQWFDE